MIHSAVELGILPMMPVLPKLPKRGGKILAAPGADVTTLLAGARDWMKIALAAFAGLRSGEVRALEVRDIDLKRDEFSIRRAFSADVVLTPKNGHERMVPIRPVLHEILEKAIKDKLPKARLVVTNRRTTPKRQLLLTRLNTIARRHGLTEWSFHPLRHAFVSILIRNGASVEAVRLLAGHSGLDTTQRYVHATAEDLRAAIRRR